MRRKHTSSTTEPSALSNSASCKRLRLSFSCADPSSSTFAIESVIETLFDTIDDAIFISILSYLVSAGSGHVDGASIRSVLSVSKRWYTIASSEKLWKPVAAAFGSSADTSTWTSIAGPAPSLRAVSVPSRPEANLSLSTLLQDKMIGFAKLGPINGDVRLQRVKERATGTIYAVKMPHSKTEGVANTTSRTSGNILRELSLLSRCTETSTSKHLSLMKQVLHSSPHGEFIRWYELADMTLEDLVKIGRPLSLVCGKDVLQQMLSGVCALHVCGVVHQNLIPKNILLHKVTSTRSFTVKIGGLSSVSVNAFPRGTSTCNSNLVVADENISYKAPELLLGQNYCSSEVDIWAVGCMFAQILRGSSLFNAQSSINQLFQVFRLLGSPSPNTSPHLVSLPYYHRELFPVWRENYLERILPQLNHHRAGLDLVFSMLHLNPGNRITAEAALRHSFLDDSKAIGTKEVCAPSPLKSVTMTSSESRSNSTGLVSKTIIQHFQRQEINYPVIEKEQTLVRSDKWATLVDWIIEIVDVFDKSPRSAFLAMQYFLDFTALVKIRTKRYQLVAAACLHLASASEDPLGIKADDLVFAGDRSFSSVELIALERLIIGKIGGRFGQPLAYDFVSLYLDSTPELCDNYMLRQLCRYISELALQSGMHQNDKPSLVGASIILLSLICAGRSYIWPKRMEGICGYSIEMLEGSTVALSENIHHVGETLPHLKVVTQRFKKTEKYCVATVHIPVLEDLQDYMDTDT